MEPLYYYIFWYNPIEKIWYAIHRDSQLVFFNGNRKEAEYLKSSEINTLIELICKPHKLKEVNESKS
jgi:predicted transglutaminase-like protease